MEMPSYSKIPEELVSLKSFETILTDRFLLRRLEDSDYLALYKAASDPQIWAQHPEVLRYQEPVFQGYFIKIMGFEVPLIIEDRSTGLAIGTSSFYEFRPKERRVSLGYTFLECKYWGGATNLEIKRALVGWALTQVEAVELEIAPTNLRSRRAAEKVGAVLDRYVHTETLGGEPRVRCVYVISKPIP